MDSEAYICQAAIQMFSEMGVVAIPSEFKPFVGMGENQYIGGVAEMHGLILDIEQAKTRTYQLYSEIVHQKLQPLPGVYSFLEACQARGLKLALATSADKVKMETNLAEIGIGTDTFHALVNGLDIARKKPYPDIYLRASALLGLDPEECLVVEDAVSGVEAAKAAGCRCLAVTGSFKAPELMGADWVCSSLEAVPLGVLNW